VFVKKKPLIICVCGPTAAGKTALALRLCRSLGGEVVSADSMQIYRGMDIVTARPSPEELAQARHHMIGVADPAEGYSVARYAKEAGLAIEEILSHGALPVVCGGTGLYIRALLDGGAMGGFEGDADIRCELKEIYAVQGSDKLHELLAARDPESAARLHPNDVKRVTRALEVHMATGVTIGEYNRKGAETPEARSGRYDAEYLALSFRDRGELYRRIDRRVDDMLSRGLEREARMYYDRPGALGPTAAGAIGYKEFFSYFDGSITLEQAAADIKKRTRNYAKRQLTWFSREPRCRWLWRDDAGYEAEVSRFIKEVDDR